MVTRVSVEQKGSVYGAKRTFGDAKSIVRDRAAWSSVTS